MCLSIHKPNCFYELNWLYQLNVPAQCNVIVSTVRAPPVSARRYCSPPFWWTRPRQQPFSVEPHLRGVWPISLPSCLRLVKEKEKTPQTVYFSQRSYLGGEKEPSPGAYVAWNASGGRVTPSARFLHLVCWLQSIRAGWLDRRGLWGHCVCLWRDALSE